MKKILILSLALLATVSLGGCKKGEKPQSEQSSESEAQGMPDTIDRAGFKKVLQMNKDYIEAHPEVFENFTITDGDAIQGQPTNYKENEFYQQKALFTNYSLFKDGGEFLVYENKGIFSSPTLKSVDEQTWNGYMSTRKQAMVDRVMRPLQVAEELLAEEESGTSERRMTAKFSKTYAGNARLDMTIIVSELEQDPNNYEEMIVVENKYVHSFYLTENLPSKYNTSKNGTDDIQDNFKFGKASFTDPRGSSEE